MLLSVGIVTIKNLVRFAQRNDNGSTFYLRQLDHKHPSPLQRCHGMSFHLCPPLPPLILLQHHHSLGYVYLLFS